MKRSLAWVLGATAVALVANCGGGGGGGGTGGVTATGGAATGGAATGGAATGGAATGGAATGGAATGGAATGGAATGGAQGGHSGGATATGGSATGGKGGGTPATGGGGGGSSSSCANGPSNIPPTGGMTLTSPDQAECAKFDVKYTCACGTMNTGITCTGNVGMNGNNPELNWDNVPSGTKSFALTFLDTTQLDKMTTAGTQMGNHWAMWNIPAAARKLPGLSNGKLTGDLMGAKETSAFFEPCPSGTDKYEFALYALSTDTLNVSGNGVQAVRDALKMATPLAVATLHGTTGAMGK